MARSRLVTIQDEKQIKKSTSYIGSFLSSSASLLSSLAKNSYSVVKTCATNTIKGVLYGCWNGAFTGAAFVTALIIPCEMGLPREYRFSLCSPSSKELEAFGGFMLIGAITGAVSGAISGAAYGLIENVYPIDSHFKSTDSTKLKLLKGAALGAGYTLMNAAVLHKVFSFEDVVKCVSIPAMMITPAFYAFVNRNTVASSVPADSKTSAKPQKAIRAATAGLFQREKNREQNSMHIIILDPQEMRQLESIKSSNSKS
jgi:hypothetical protein